MTPKQLARVPDSLLIPTRRGALDLIEWLNARGWAMSLAELEDERRKRGLTYEVHCQHPNCGESFLTTNPVSAAHVGGRWRCRQHRRPETQTAHRERTGGVAW